MEIASPTQFHRPDLGAKARLWLDRGVRLVWVVWPEKRQVDVWRPDHPTAPVATLGTGDRLDGEDLIPGFSLPVADIFADPLGTS